MGLFFKILHSIQFIVREECEVTDIDSLAQCYRPRSREMNTLNFGSFRPSVCLPSYRHARPSASPSLMKHKVKDIHIYFYRPRSKWDNTFGSVCLSFRQCSHGWGQGQSSSVREMRGVINFNYFIFNSCISGRGNRKGLWGEGTLQHRSREVCQRSGVFIFVIFDRPTGLKRAEKNPPSKKSTEHGLG